MTPEIIAAIKQKIKDETYIQDVRVFNDQFTKMLADGNPFGYNIASPAALIEFSPSSIEQLGNGVQIYNPIQITIHIGQMELDGNDALMDEAISIFELRNQVYLAMQEFSTEQMARMYRVSENPDYNHGNWYVYQIVFETSITDHQAQRPKGYVEASPTLTTTGSYQ